MLLVFEIGESLDVNTIYYTHTVQKGINLLLKSAKKALKNLIPKISDSDNKSKQISKKTCFINRL